MFFDDCTTLDELKAAYKRLVMLHHPDRGGDLRTMQAVNMEHDKVFERLKRAHNAEAARPESAKHATTETPEEFRRVVEALLNLDGIEVELCGSWLWIAGNTYPHRAAIKAAGCGWSRSKRKWYWHHAEDGTWSRGKATMEDIRKKYGSEWLTATGKRGMLTA